MKRVLSISLGCLFWAFQAICQPTDNPYRTYYQPGQYHWTDSLKWNNTYLATSHGISPQTDSATNITNLRLLINTVSQNGGGVIFFPAGEYRFSDSLELKSNVILRGEIPVVKKAKDSLFRPLSRLVFPKYIPSLTGNGTPIQTAFKSIQCEANARNIALVHLDIQRARVFFMPKAYFHNPNPKGVGGWPGGVIVGGVPGTYLPSDQPENVLIFGIRQNNVAFPDPSVPSSTQNAWQRWAYRFGNNIDLNVRRNGIVNNNRLNDKTEDNYAQPGYNGNSCTGLPADGSASRFNYTDHYGITVNRLKLLLSLGSDQKSKATNYGNLLLALPEDEPYFYAPGNEINDNWIFKTSRVAIYAAGNGLQMRRNETHDQQGKVSWIQPGGTACNVVGSTTFENRGIDFSGWNLYIDSNQIEVYNNQIKNGPYKTPDGEFLLLQECCGGTPVNGYHITHNIGNSYIGLYKVRDITNAEISFNRATPPNNSNFASGIFVDANTSSPGSPGNITPYSISNTLIEGNQTTNGVTIVGAKAGANTIFRNNTCLDNTNLTVSCYVKLENNTGFASTIYKGLNDNATVTSPCNEATDIPGIAVNFPAQDTVIPFESLPSNLPIRIKFKNGNYGNIKNTLYANGTKLADGLVFDNLADSTLTFNWQIPLVPNQTYFISGKGTDTVSGLVTYASPVKVEVRQTTGVTGKQKGKESIEVYPNPMEDKNLSLVRKRREAAQVEITSMDGRLIKKCSWNADQIQLNLHLPELVPGMYLMKYKGPSATEVKKVVVR